MASIRFLDKKPFHVKFSEQPYSASRFKETNTFRTTIEHNLPFRIRFTSIGVPGYAPPGFPGIGIQIIEYNNYIL